MVVIPPARVLLNLIMFLLSFPTGGVDYYRDHAKFDKLYRDMVQDPYIKPDSVESFFQSYKEFMNTTSSPMALPYINSTSKQGPLSIISLQQL